MSAGACLFCRIAKGEVPSEVVYANDRLVAFLDINPIRPGHTQIIPRAHFPVFDELPADLLAEMAATGQTIARALKRIYGVHRVGFAFTGTDVAHAHAHVVPLVASDDITSRRYIAEEVVTYVKAPPPAPGEFDAVAKQLRAELAATPGG
ncbi:HIT family protein [Xanthobacter autotrophicus DSM 431]|uniref:HIT family protein n=1 Tax=Xanthobacter nonsaccharivorans TaxID=3119912 RepID=UPI0037262B6F